MASPETRTTTIRLHQPRPDSVSPPAKSPNPRFLSFVLQSCVMLFVIALFFLFVGIASIFVVHICIASRSIHRRSNHRQRLAAEEDLDAFLENNGLSAEDIQNLPSSNYASLLKSVSTRDCAVCLEGFGEGEMFRILPRCKHAFHAPCIDLWLHKAPACPICRSGVVDLYSMSLCLKGRRPRVTILKVKVLKLLCLSLEPLCSTYGVAGNDEMCCKVLE